MLKWIKPEDHLCRGACCPLSVGCVRHMCFLNGVQGKSKPDAEWGDTCLTIAHRIQNRNVKVIATAELPENSLHTLKVLALVLSSELSADIQFTGWDWRPGS